MFKLKPIVFNEAPVGDVVTSSGSPVSVDAGVNTGVLDTPMATAPVVETPAVKPVKYSLPNADAGEDVWNEFYTSLRPETADGYGFEDINPNSLEVFGIGEDDIKGVKELFHEANLSKTQAEAVWQALGAFTEHKYNQSIESLKGSQEATMTALNEQWGDKTSENITKAQKTVEHLGLKDTINKLRLNNDIGLITKLAEISELFESSNGGEVLNRGQNTDSYMSKQQRDVALERAIKARDTAKSNGDLESMQKALNEIRILTGRN